MNYTIYMVNCNFTTRVTCLLKLVAYKYSELQMSFATQKLSCKASCKTPFYYHSVDPHFVLLQGIGVINLWAFVNSSYSYRS
jgi:hypothetical protein